MSDAVGKIFHSNDNYEVQCAQNADARGGLDYVVINTNSGVCEFESESLPECIFAAENLNVVLVHRTYEWIAKNAIKREAANIGLVPSIGGETH